MKMRIYTIYDKLAREGGPLFQAKNDQVAHRQFQTQLTNMPNIEIADFDLRCVGEYDNEQCQIQVGIPFTVDVEWLLFLEEAQKNSDAKMSYDMALEMYQTKKKTSTI